MSESEVDAFHIACSEDFFVTDAERLEMCLSDMYYTEDLDTITREPTQQIPPGSYLGEKYESEVKESRDSSNSTS